MVTKEGQKKRGRDYFGWSQKCCDNSGGQAMLRKEPKKMLQWLVNIVHNKYINPSYQIGTLAKPVEGYKLVATNP